jgi:uncharacterized protein
MSKPYQVLSCFILGLILLLSGCDKPKPKPEELFNAVKHNDIQSVQSLLKSGVEVNVLDEAGQTPLMWATERKNIGMAKLLIDKGANVNAVGLRVASGATALSLAAINGTAPLVRFLIERGADIKAQPGDKTLLSWAAGFGHEDVVSVLLDAGADPKIQDVKGVGVLQEAVLGGNPRVVEILLNAGCDPYLKNKLGMTARDFAKLSKSPKAAEIFALLN